MYNPNMPISRHYKKLMEDVEDADWMNDTEREAYLKSEVEHVQNDIIKGSLHSADY